MGEFIVGVVLAAVAVAWVLYPVFRPDSVVRTATPPDLVDAEDDLSPHTVALSALREIEFDRATGKLSDADYDALHRRYTAEALAAMRVEDADRLKPRVGAKPAAPSVQPEAVPVCPVHGRRPEPDAVFCSECGRRLGSVGAYCARCGTSLEADARYCQACGARSAA